MAGTKAQKYRPEMIEIIRKKLASLPEATPKELTRRQVVYGLSKPIVALRKRGYSMKAIAEVISGEGVAITGATLRGCLGGSRGKRRAVHRRRSGDAAGEARVNGAATPPVMKWDREGDGEVNAVGNTIAISGAPVRDRAVDGDVGGNPNGRKKSKLAEQERDREYTRGTPVNAAEGHTRGSPGMVRQRSVDTFGDSVETAAIHQGDTKESLLDGEVRIRGWIDQPAPTTPPDAGTVLPGTRSAGESRAGFVVREDTPDI
jgi:hypothetical protein